VIEAGVYLECEQIARSHHAFSAAEQIRDAGKLDEIQVTACKMEDFR
jgi:hypothetical protein